MEVYQGEGTYEPSADELIDVLKNLENLAAANPALYRAIVDQIKGMFYNLHDSVAFCFNSLHILFHPNYPLAIQCVIPNLRVQSKDLLVRAHK